MIVYVATNTVNGMQYVGCTTRHLSHRKDGHFRQARKGQGGPASIWKAIRDFGKDAFSFEIIEKCKSIEELRNREIHFIDKMNTLIPNGYNQNKGGSVTAGDEYAKEYIVDGKSYYGLGQLSDAFGVHELTIGVRLRRQGWTLRQALEIDDAPARPKKEGKPVEFQGMTFSSEREMCRHYGVCNNMFRARYHQNKWSLEQSLGLEQRNVIHSNNKIIKIKGTTFYSLEEAAKYFGIKRTSVSSRLHYGWSLEDALTKSVMPNSRPKPFKTYFLHGKNFDTYQGMADYLGKTKGSVRSKIYRNKGKTLDEIFIKQGAV